MSSRALILCVSGAVVGIMLGSGGATFSASAGGASPAGRPRTLFAGGRRIYAFALGAHRISWISRTHMRGRYPGCEMYVRTLQRGRTLRAPLPSAGCGVVAPHNFAPQRPVLVSGVAAWVKASSCGNTECFWKIATIRGGEPKPRVVDDVDVGCPGRPACALRHRLGKAVSALPPFPHPALAGNGNLLVYSTGRSNIDHVRRIVGLHTIPFAAPPGIGDTGQIESLVVGGGAVEAVSTVLHVGDGCGCMDAPVWSPNGSKIAYLHGTFWNQQIDPYPPSAVPAVMNADGSGRRDVTPVNEADSLSWSPDGSQIAFGTSNSGKIVVVNLDGSGSLQVGSGFGPAWSPDGAKIAFGSAVSSTAIFTVNPDGSNLQVLASFPSHVLGNGMAWSPDGTRIAFSLDGVLEVMNADGSNAHPLGSGTRGDEPSWSPDGSQIVFRTGSGLSVIGADGTGLRQLTNGQTDEHPSWSPDGQTIVFGSDRNDPYFTSAALPELYLVDADGSNLRPLSFTTPTAFEQQETFYTATGHPLASLPGVPTLAGNTAAVGSTSPSGMHEITLFDSTTGTQLAAVPVGRGSHFSVRGANRRWVVFQVARTISALNVNSRAVVRLTTAAANPVNLSVAGRRVAWAENIHNHGRIRALELPG